MTYNIATGGGGGGGGTPGPPGPGVINWRDEWSNLATYDENDAVNLNGSSYICLNDGTTSEPPSDDWDYLALKGDTGATGATGSAGAPGADGDDGADGEDGISFVWLGSYDSMTAYVENDVVSYNGSSYINISASTGVDPSDTDHWQVMALKGSTGATGSTGAPGADGSDGQGFTERGSWDNSTGYVAYDVVESDGSTYVATASSTGQLPPNITYWQLWAAKGDTGATGAPGDDGDAGPAGPGVINWLGEWDSGTTYHENDAVDWEGSSYISLGDNTNSEPPSADWNYLALKGDTGATGSTGADGAPGADGSDGADGEDGSDGADGTSFIWQGAYDAMATYHANDVVSFNGSSYIATATTSGNDPSDTDHWDLMAEKGDTGPTGDPGADGDPGDPGLIWKGPWDSMTAYAVNDAVSDAGSSYICTSSHTGHEPPNLTYWDILVEKGDTGADGDDGDDGADGTSFTWLGPYSGATTYAANDVVSYQGSSFIALSSTMGNLPTDGVHWEVMAEKGDTGATGSTGSTGSPGADGTSFTWKGAWSSLTTYHANDVVSLSGTSYISKTTNSNSSPDSNPSDWDVMAQKGSTGSTGTTGATGNNAGIKYTFDSTTTNSDPGSGKFRLNNATPASATALYISETDADGNGIAGLIGTVAASTSTLKGYLNFVKDSDPSKIEVFSVSALSDNGSWDTLTIVNVTSTGTFTNGDAIRVFFTRTGDKGDTGATGSAGSNGSNGSNGTNGADGTRRNAIINGAMNIWQRGTTFTTPADGVYTADRWRVTNGANNELATWSRDTDVPAVATSTRQFTYSLKCQVATLDSSIGATESYGVSQRIEGFNWQAFHQQGVTLSFYVKNHVTGTYSVALSNGTDRSIVAEYTVNVADTWEKKTVTFTASPSGGTWALNEAEGARLIFTLAAGSNFTTATLNPTWNSDTKYASTNQVNWLSSTSNTFFLTGVQLEVGSAATPFAFTTQREELADCQRYYNKTFPYATAPAQNATIAGALRWNCPYIASTANLFAWAYTYKFPVPMRATPGTITYYNPLAANANWAYNSSTTVAYTPSTSTSDNTGLIVGGASQTPQTNNDSFFITGHITADAEL